MFRRNIYISLSIFNASLNRINIISLVNLFTAIRTKLNIILVINFFDGNNLILKFIDTKLYNLISIYNGYSNLYSLYYSVFIR